MISWKGDWGHWLDLHSYDLGGIFHGASRIILSVFGSFPSYSAQSFA